MESNNTQQNSKKKIWFPAKRYGWGWGIPCAWQGWVVLVFWMVGTIVLSIIFNPQESKEKFFAAIAISIFILLIICYIKGEKPGWRWGDKKPRH